MRWFTSNPVLMGCLPPIVLYVGIGIVVLLLRGAAIAAIGPFQAALFVLGYAFLRYFRPHNPGSCRLADRGLGDVLAMYFSRRRS